MITVIPGDTLTDQLGVFLAVVNVIIEANEFSPVLSQPVQMLQDLLVRKEHLAQ